MLRKNLAVIFIDAQEIIFYTYPIKNGLLIKRLDS